MTILLERLDSTTQQPEESVDITGLLTDLDQLSGTNLIGIFPTGTWKSGDQTPNGIWDLDTLIGIFAQSRALLLQMHPETPGFSEKPAASLTAEDKAYLETQPHTSVTNTDGVHVIRLVTPIPAQASVATPLIERIGQLDLFLKSARNAANFISVLNTELNLSQPDTSQQQQTPEDVSSQEQEQGELAPIEG